MSPNLRNNKYITVVSLKSCPSGEANVLQEFQVSEGKKKVPVAGCRCVKGSLVRNALYRVIRAQEVVFEGILYKSSYYIFILYYMTLWRNASGFFMN